MELDAMAGLRALPRLDFDVRFDHPEELGSDESFHRSTSSRRVSASVRLDPLTTRPLAIA
jgi:hypothetical protein